MDVIYKKDINFIFNNGTGLIELDNAPVDCVEYYGDKLNKRKQSNSKILEPVKWYVKLDCRSEEDDYKERIIFPVVELDGLKTFFENKFLFNLGCEVYYYCNDHIISKMDYMHEKYGEKRKLHLYLVLGNGKRLVGLVGKILGSYYSLDELPEEIPNPDCGYKIDKSLLLEVTNDNFRRICNLHIMKFYIDWRLGHNYVTVLGKNDIKNVDLYNSAWRTKCIVRSKRKNEEFIISGDFFSPYRFAPTAIQEMITDREVENINSVLEDYRVSENLKNVYLRLFKQLDYTQEEIAWMKGKIRVPEYDDNLIKNIIARYDRN